jgi:hypothetical protein
MMTLAQIKAEIDRRAVIIGAAGDSSLPTYGRSDGDGHPHIEVDDLAYHYVVEQRGREVSRVSTTDLDELLYHVFRGVTFRLAGIYEVNHRAKNQDFRRILFQRQIDLLSQLSAPWSKRCAQELELILRDHPFDDNSNIRVKLTTDLRKSGYSADAAWLMACDKYPLPSPVT